MSWEAREVQLSDLGKGCFFGYKATIWKVVALRVGYVGVAKKAPFGGWMHTELPGETLVTVRRRRTQTMFDDF